MAGNAVVGIDVVARLEQFERSLAKIPDIGGKEAKALAAQFSREIKANTAAVKAHDAALKSAGKSAGDASKGFKIFKDAAGAAGYGDLAEKAGKLGSVFDALLSPVGLAAAGVAALAASAVGGTAALAASVFAADDALKSLEGFKRIGSDFYPAVPPATLASIEAVNAATTALGSVFDRAVVQLGGSVAPAFEQVADVAVGLALVAEETFEKFLKGRSVLHDFAVTMVEGVVTAVTLPIKPMQALAAGIMAVALATGHELPAGVKESVDSFLALQHTVAEGAVSLVENSSAASALGDALDGVSAKGAAFISTQERATKALKAANKQIDQQVALLNFLSAAENKFASADTDAFRSAVDGMDELADAAERAKASKADQLALDHEAALRKIDDLHNEALQAGTTAEARETADRAYRDASVAEYVAYYAATDQLRQEDAKKAEDAAKKAADAEKAHLDLIRQSAEQVGGMVTDALDTMSDGFRQTYDVAAHNVEILTGQMNENEDEYTDAQKAELKKRIDGQKNAARAAFEAQKIGAMASAAVNTALAVSSALASAPPPYNAIPAGIAFAAGVAEEALIASEQPAFHAGGLAPDERMYRMIPGEVAVSKQGVSASGGPDAFNQANAGVSSGLGGDVWVVSAYRHTNQVARYERDRLSRNSPTMQEITKGRTPGVRGL